MVRQGIKIAVAAVVAILIGMSPAHAEGEFSQGSEVKGWGNLQGREPALFKAKVTDIVCALTGDCPENCGGGERQMGLLREADGKLILAAKNSQASFNGATVDLAPYCGQTVTVDGLLVGNPELTKTKFYQVFRIQREGSDKWAAAKRWTRTWKRLNPEAQGKKGPWYRHDPRVQAQLQERGYLGLGAEADAKFIEENY